MAINMLERVSNVNRLFLRIPTLCGSLAGDFSATFWGEFGGASRTALLAAETAESHGGRVLLRGLGWLILGDCADDLERGHIGVG
jgi:hypothetical protein